MLEKRSYYAMNKQLNTAQTELLCDMVRMCVFPVFSSSEDAMRKAGTAHTKSSTDMENHIFVKAKSRVSIHSSCSHPGMPLL